MANPLAQAALDGLRIGREEAQQANRSQQAKDWYENWKKTNGLPKDSNALPPVDVTPTWARPYLFPRADASPQSDLQIAGGVLLPGETPAGGKGGLGSMNKDQLERWIKENGITGAGADKIRNKWKNLGADLPPLSQVTPGPAPVWPSHKWPYPTPGQGPLPDWQKDLQIAGVDYNKNMPQNYRDWSEFHRKNYEEKSPGWLDRMIDHTKNYPG